MDALLVLSTSRFRAAATFALETTYGSHLHIAANTEEAISLLLSGRKFDLILLEHPYSAEAVLQILSENNIDIAVVVYVALSTANLENLKAPHLLGFIKGSDTIPTLLQITAPLATQVEGTKNSESESLYCRIHSELIENQINMPCDIFILEENKQFSIAYKKGSSFSQNVRQINAVSKPEFFFVRKDDANLLLDLITSELDKALASPNFNPHIADQIAVRTQEMTAVLIQRVGLTPEVLNMIRKNVSLTIQSIGSRPSLKNLMARILLDRKKYISSHSVSLAQITCAISAAVGWESAFTYQKLVLASFFHDIVIDDQDLAMLQTKEELDKVKNSSNEEVIKNYLLHPLRAAELVKRSPDAPPDVDIIISQHHERPDGTGFPRGLNGKQIAPLAAIFIVAHALVSAMYKYEDKFDMDQFLAKHEEAYSYGNFRKAYRALKGFAKSDDSAA